MAENMGVYWMKNVESSNETTLEVDQKANEKRIVNETSIKHFI